MYTQGTFYVPFLSIFKMGMTNSHEFAQQVLLLCAIVLIVFFFVYTGCSLILSPECFYSKISMNCSGDISLMGWYTIATPLLYMQWSTGIYAIMALTIRYAIMSFIVFFSVNMFHFVVTFFSVNFFNAIYQIIKSLCLSASPPFFIVPKYAAVLVWWPSCVKPDI